MHSIVGVLRLGSRQQALRWTQRLCGAFPAHSRHFASDNGEGESAADLEEYAHGIFDAAEQGAPRSVHQLIGDPRTGIADDTTTTPWGEDVSVEWVWSSQNNGVNWYRYSLAGPDQLPHMYMDSRLSDHSKNLMYMLRCKDPDRWTIPALAEKFRVRRQRVMAILTLKEMQAHRIEQGQDMQGPLQPYTFKIPLQDIHVQPDGQPVDLAQLVAEQGQQQQQAAAAAAATSSSLGVDAGPAAEGLGSLEDFLAPESSSSADEQPNALSSLAAAAGDQAADLAVLMPQIALTTQQLLLQLLQLLQQHHYSTEELQRKLLQQVDVAEAYYNRHVAGTRLEKMLLGLKVKAPKKAAAAAAEGEAGGETVSAEPAAAKPKPAWLDFEKQRQEIKQLVAVLAPVLQYAGPEQDREAGRLLAALKHALHEAAAATPAAATPAAAATGDQAEGAEQQQQQEQQASPHAAGLSDLVKSASSDSAVFTAAFNQLDLSSRQQLLDLVPEARILLNIQGTDLKAALASSSTDASSSSSEAAASSSAAAPGLWPGQVPPVVDVWGYEEVPRKQLAAVQQQLVALQPLMAQVHDVCAGLASEGSSSSSSSSIGAEELAAVQQATQVYAGLIWEYDKVLTEQAMSAVGAESASPPLLAPSAQRRLMRILRQVDGNALEKLLLWESYFKEEAGQGPGDRGRLRRLKARVHEAIKQMDQAAAAAGQAGPFDDYPDLPPDVPAAARVEKDLAAAHLDAVVVGRQFHRGSGDRHYVRLDSYPAFEGYSLEEFDKVDEGELSAVSRLTAERQDNMMWKEFRERLLRNIGLTAPDLYQHLGHATPPKPRKGWSWVVHPMGGAARALTRQQLRRQAREQWLDDEQLGGAGSPGDLGSVQEVLDPAQGPAPAEPYVAAPGGKFRGLNEEEAVVVGASRAKPRRRWYASTRAIIR